MGLSRDADLSTPLHRPPRSLPSLDHPRQVDDFSRLIAINERSSQTRFYWSACCAELNRNMAMVAGWAAPADSRDHGEAKTRSKRARCPPSVEGGRTAAPAHDIGPDRTYVLQS